ncbi:MAG: hypothetical protein LBT47_05665 [Deltaproteobacteria bacterium]|jgi:predicted transposase YbfD/YdcC|nr:hypothetical protein [Deltaproteobacteria bacterium]
MNGYQQKKEWVGINTVFKVTRSVEYKKGKLPTTETRFFISSLSLGCKQMLEISIMHWSVETRHNILNDTETFAEDKCRVYRGNGAEFLSIMRKLGINFLLPFNRIYDSESFRGIIDMCRRYLPLLEAILTKNAEEVGYIKEWRKRMSEGQFASFVPK